MAFFRACCRQSASTLDSPSSKERPSASAIAAMFPNDAAAICPPKMRLTVGMETPLRDAKLWNPIPSIFRRVCRRSAVIGRILLMVFSYHIRYIFRNQKRFSIVRGFTSEIPRWNKSVQISCGRSAALLGNWDNHAHLRKIATMPNQKPGTPLLLEHFKHLLQLRQKFINGFVIQLSKTINAKNCCCFSNRDREKLSHRFCAEIDL